MKIDPSLQFHSFLALSILKNILARNAGNRFPRSKWRIQLVFLSRMNKKRHPLNRWKLNPREWRLQRHQQERKAWQLACSKPKKVLLNQNPLLNLQPRLLGLGIAIESRQGFCHARILVRATATSGKKVLHANNEGEIPLSSTAIRIDHGSGG